MPGITALRYGEKNSELEARLARTSAAPFAAVRVDANDDFVYIYTSGTTGAPKCIVHGAGVLSDALLDKKTDAQFEADLKVVTLPEYLLLSQGNKFEGPALWSWYTKTGSPVAYGYVLDPRTISPSLDLLFLAKAIERVGDHAKNLAEAVIYVVKGTDVRHSPVDSVESMVR